MIALHNRVRIWVWAEHTKKCGLPAWDRQGVKPQDLVAYHGNKANLVKLANQMYTRAIHGMYGKHRTFYLTRVAHSICAHFDLVPVDLRLRTKVTQDDLPF